MRGTDPINSTWVYPMLISNNFHYNDIIIIYQIKFLIRLNILFNLEIILLSKIFIIWKIILKNIVF
jgi:hypothetical protein